jgi:uncharacterized membrane protein
MVPETKTSTLQDVARYLLGSFMVTAGTGHLTFVRQEFQAQVPDWVPMNKDTVVLLSGVVEIGLGLALILSKKQNKVRMGLGLAAFYAAIFPGNIHQYTHHLSAFGLDTDGKRLARLFMQPVLMGVVLWSTGAWNEQLAPGYSQVSRWPGASAALPRGRVCRRCSFPNPQA